MVAAGVRAAAAAGAAVAVEARTVVEEVHTVVEVADLTAAAEVRTEAVLTDARFLQLRPAPIWGGPFFADAFLRCGMSQLFSTRSVYLQGRNIGPFPIGHKEKAR
jgi:predicted LPLAT superfamily acyltransferase